MKRIFKFLLIISFFSGLSLTYEKANASVMELFPSLCSGKKGDELTLVVKVDYVRKLSAVQIQIQYDPTMLEVIDANADGEGILAYGTIFPNGSSKINELRDGKIYYHLMAADDSYESFTGAGTLTLAKFKTLKEGISKVLLIGEGTERCLLLDREGLRFPLELKDATIIVDNTPPTVSITNPSEGAKIGGIVSVNADASDENGISKVDFYLDGTFKNTDSSSPYIWDWDTKSYSDGAHSLKVVSSDRVENNATVEINVKVDNTLPESVLEISEPKYKDGDRIHISHFSSVTLTGVDPVVNDFASGVDFSEYRVDTGNWLVYVTSFSLTEGIHTIDYRSKDKVGNYETTKSTTLYVDATSPTTERQIAGPRYQFQDKTYVSSFTTFTLTAVDPVKNDVASGVESIKYRIDSGSWINYSSPFNLSEGVHGIEYFSIDGGGNQETAKSSTLYTDSNAPLTNLVVNGYSVMIGTLTYAPLATTYSLEAEDPESNGVKSGVANTLYRIDSGNWQSWETGQNISLTEGVRTIEYYSMDNVVNREEKKTQTFYVDAAPPVSQFQITNPKFQIGEVTYLTSETQLSITATDPLVNGVASGFSYSRYRINQGAWQVNSGPFKLSGADGSYAIEYYSVDKVRNTEKLKTENLILDNTSPDITSFLGAPRYATAISSFVTSASPITLTMTDTGSGLDIMEYKIDSGNWTNYVSSFNIVAEGQHTISYRGKDRLGNLSTTKTISVAVDNTSPSSTISVGSPKSAEYFTSQTSFTLASIDGGAIPSGVQYIQYRVSSGTWQNYAQAFYLTGADGSYTIDYRASDNLINTETYKSLTAKLDNTPPSTSLSIGSPKYISGSNTWITSATNITLSATDAGSGVQKTEYKIDSGSWFTYTSVFTISGEGSHTIYYRSQDKVNNLESTKSISIIVDNTSPTSSISVGLPKSAEYVTSATSFSLTSVDGGAIPSGVKEIKYSINQSPITNYQSPFVLIGADGNYTIDYRSADNLGNLETFKSLTARLDNTPPTTVLTVDRPQYRGTESIRKESLHIYYRGYKEYHTDYLYPPSGYKITSWGLYNVSSSSGGKDNGTYIDTVNNRLVIQTYTGGFYFWGTKFYGSFSADYFIECSKGETWISSKTAITLLASDGEGSGIAFTGFKIDEEEWKTYNGPLTIPTEGEHTIYYRSQDKVSNLETTKSVTVIVDNTSPTSSISVGSPKSNEYVTSQTSFALTSIDGGIIPSGVQYIEYRINQGDWIRYTQAFYLSGADGNYTIDYRATDNLNNLETYKSLSVKLDNTSPVTSLTIGTPKYTSGSNTWVTSQTNIMLSATDSGSGVQKIEYKIDSGSWFTYTSVFTISGEGSHTIYYRSQDKVANLESTKSISIIVDNTSPTSSISVGLPKSAEYVTSVTSITLSSVDGGAIPSGIKYIEYRISSGTWQNYTQAFYLTGADGSYTIDYRASDNLINTETYKSLTAKLDNTPPSTSLSIGSPKYISGSNTWITSATGITLSASDAGAGIQKIEYKIDSGSWFTYTSVFTISGEGSHTIYYRSQDKVNNLESTKSISVIVDNTTPTSSISAGTPKSAEYVTSATSFSLTSVDGGAIPSGVQCIQYRINSGTWQNYTQAFYLSGTDGNYTIDYRAVDNLNNLETYKSLSVKLDNTPPVSSLTIATPKYALGSNTWITSNTGITLTATDSGSGVLKTEYRIDSGNWITYSSAFTISGEGSHTIYYRSQDKVNNLESTKSFQLL